MPILPPALHDPIIDLCVEQFRLPDGRDEILLKPAFKQWDGFADIDWTGAARVFSRRLIDPLPGDLLKLLLRSLVIGDRGYIEQLCAAVDASAELQLPDNPARYASYYRATTERLSEPRYQIDSRFVKLTLLLDQGADAQGVRFVNDGERGRFDSLATLLAETDAQAFVLLGRPGSGKTTLLRRYQFEQAWDGLADKLDKVPFFVPLNAYSSAEGSQASLPPRQWLADQWQLRERTQHPDLPDFETLFSDGKLLLLLDGLNEMPHRDKTEYRERVTGWRHFLAETKACGNLTLFSCRSLNYSASLSSDAQPVRQVQVEPLSAAQIEQFLLRYLEEEGSAVWRDHLRDDSQQQALFNAPFFLKLLVDEISATGHMPAGRGALLTGFVRRAMRREIERDQRLFQPDHLLSEDDVMQVLQDAWDSAVALPSDGVLIPQLAQLAFAMQDGRESREAGEVRLPVAKARQYLDPTHAEDLIAAGIQLNVLDKELSTRELFFFHQLIQEYFAARKLADAPDPARVLVPWHVDAVDESLADTLAGLEVGDPLPGLPATGWEETVLLMAALLSDPNDFVTALMAHNLPLAGRCAAAPDVAVAPALTIELQQALLTRIADPQADLRARIGAAEALGELGDPRFEPMARCLLPPLVPIAGGTYTIGNDHSQYKHERPAHSVEIAPFEMGRFPVTNAEYRLFIEAGGYEDERWWDSAGARAWLSSESGNEGPKQAARDAQAYLQDFSDDTLRSEQVSPDQINYWLWLKHASAEELERQYNEWYPVGDPPRQPNYWEDSRFNRPAQPVVGVSWYEARAYCAWLSAETKQRYSLPTEAEWEAAATGLERRGYAYGAEYDVSACNTFETHIRRTTPVGVFPGGSTPQGIADLSGNVWEWCSTLWGESLQSPDFPYPYDAADGREDVANTVARRVVRGGSWYNDQSYARAAYRYFNRPDNRASYQGFRVVRRPPS